MAEKDDARRNIEHARDYMSEIAEELMRRSSPDYVKDRAREAVMRKSVETRDRVKESPMAWKIIGGALGVGLGTLLSKRYQASQLRRTEWHEDLDVRYQLREPLEPTYAQRGVGVRSGVVADSYGYAAVSEPTAGVYAEPLGGEADLGLDLDRGRAGKRSADLKARASEKAGELKAKASDTAADLKARAGDKADHLRDRAMGLKEDARERLHDVRAGMRERVSEVRHHASERLHDARLNARGRIDGVRDRLPSAHDVRLKASAGWQRGVDQEPLAIAFGALALGAAASFLLPVTDSERRLLRPARERVRGKLDEVKKEARSRIEQVRGQALDQLSTLKGQAEEGLQQFKGQAVAGLKGEQAEGERSWRDGQSDLNLEGSGVTAHADAGGVYTSPAADAPEELRSPGLIQHEPNQRPSETAGSYDPKLTH